MLLLVLKGIHLRSFQGYNPKKLVCNYTHRDFYFDHPLAGRRFTSNETDERDCSSLLPFRSGLPREAALL